MQFFPYVCQGEIFYLTIFILKVFFFPSSHLYRDGQLALGKNAVQVCGSTGAVIVGDDEDLVVDAALLVQADLWGQYVSLLAQIKLIGQISICQKKQKQKNKWRIIRLNIPQFQSFKIHRSPFLNYNK